MEREPLEKDTKEMNRTQSVQSVFALGMKRAIPQLLPVRTNGSVLNLGSGRAHIHGAHSLDLPEWDATKDDIPYENGSVSHIHAYHFFEHFVFEDVVRILRECERVLQVDGILQIGVPHALAIDTHQDLQHKSLWTEGSLEHLFSNTFYNPDVKSPVPGPVQLDHSWHFHIHASWGIFIVSRNIMQFWQLVRTLPQ